MAQKRQITLFLAQASACAFQVKYEIALRIPFLAQASACAS